MNNSPIGIFDSGLGGLTVVKQLLKILPNEDFVYLGDTARVPYGTRSKDIIQKFSFEDAQFLVGKKAKCIIIACHTSSAVAGKLLKKKLKIPIFDVVTPTIDYLKGQKSGVIGTRATIASGVYKLDYQKACPLFVPFIEEGEVESEALLTIIKNYLKDFRNINSLVLGCTHYPIIEKQIQKVVGKDVVLINPGELVVNQVKNYLVKNNLTNTQKRPGKREFFVTDLNERFIKVAEMFLGQKIKPDLKKIDL